jgi:dolichyl-diphosphooligosaccharide--protein glycosyltransferase
LRADREWLKAKIRPEFVVLLVIAFISFWIRIVIPWSNVFQNGKVMLGGNDPYYHMRLTEVTIHNFPHRMWFDPMTNFPHGSVLYWGPIHDQIVAFLALIAGFGSPDTHTVYAVGAIIPAVLGILLLIPVYVIARELWGIKAALFASLIIAVLPGQILSRTILGFADHHANEIFFSTLTIMFLVLAIKERRIEFSLRSRSFLYLIGASISYAVYQLSWTGALMFALLISIFIIVQAVVDHLRGRRIDYICMCSLIFLLPLFLVLPICDFKSFGYLYYSIITVAALLLATILGPLLLSLSRLMDKLQKRTEHSLTLYYPIVLVAVGIIVLFIISNFVPSLFSTIKSAFTILTKSTVGELTIAEATPIFFPRGKFTLDMVNGNFGMAFYLSLVGLALLFMRIIKKWKAEEMLILVWSIVIFDAMYQQNRFAYYYAVNVALLTGLVLSYLVDRMGMQELSKKYVQSVHSFKGFHEPFVKILKEIKPLNLVFLVFVIVIILVYPWPGILPTSVASAKGVGGPPPGWVESLDWMKTHTPDPGVDYYGIYDPGNFTYPPEAYGVMSWWDYGHWILAIGHRMPNANPFQQGIGGGPDHKPGASTFFTTTQEGKANQIADELGVRYVVSDAEMATGKFYAMAAWALDLEGWTTYAQYGIMGHPVNFPVLSEKYHSSMIARLHLYDGVSLSHYRLVHESPGYYVFYQVADMNTGGVYRGAQSFSEYTDAEKFYNMIKPFYVDTSTNMVAFDPLPPVSYVKVFEYVKGARIIGSAPEGENVTLSITIFTPARTFTYTQTTVSDGHYEFVVPYSTQGPEEGSTLYDIGPLGPYEIRFGDEVVRVNVSEEAVLNGETIVVG